MNNIDNQIRNLEFHFSAIQEHMVSILRTINTYHAGAIKLGCDIWRCPDWYENVTIAAWDGEKRQRITLSWVESRMILFQKFDYLRKELKANE